MEYYLFMLGFGILFFLIMTARDRLKVLERELKSIRKLVVDVKMSSQEETQPKEEIVAVSKTVACKQETVLTASTTEHKKEREPVSVQQEVSKPIVRKPQKPLSQNPVFKFIKDFFTTGNVVVKVGVVILIFGVSFLLKYAASKNYFPMELRLVLVALLGVGFVFLGWFLRKKKEVFALMIQGTGIAIVYLTTFTAFRVYHFMPAIPAFAVLLVTVIGSAFLAIKQDAKTLAVIGLSGGFLAPILVSTGSGNYIALFSFYTILNVGVILIAWFKSWRFLNVLSFTFTFGIGAIWGLEYYKPMYFSTTEPFLIIFFLMYISLVLLYAIKQTTNVNNLVDGSLVFGTPLVCFSLQAALVKDTEYGLAISSLVLGLFYSGLVMLLWKKQKEHLKQLIECFLAIAVIFIALTIPLAFNAQWTSALWALKGLGLVWIGIRQQRLLSRYFGSFLILIAGFTVFTFLEAGYETNIVNMAFINGSYLGCLVKAIAAMGAAYLLFKHRDKLNKFDQVLVNVFIVYGLFWWFFGIGTELKEYFSVPTINYVGLAFILISYFAGNFLVKKYTHAKSELFLFACFVLAAITPLFILSAYYTSIAWVLLGFLAVMQNRKETYVSIIYLGYLGAASSFFALINQMLDYSSWGSAKYETQRMAMFNIYFVSAFVRSIACFFVGWFSYDRTKKYVSRNFFAMGFLCVAVVQWLFMGAFELYEHAHYEYWFSLFTIFCVLTVVLLELLQKPMRWKQLVAPCFAMLPVFWFCFLILLASQTEHPFTDLGWLAWPLIIVQQYWFLYRHDVSDLSKNIGIKAYHLFLFWLVLCLVSWEGSYHLTHHIFTGLPWMSVVYCAIPMGIALILVRLYKKIQWPIKQHATTYLDLALIPVVLYALVWTVFINEGNSGDVLPFVYIPLINPIDLSLCLVFGTVIYWLFVQSRDKLMTLSNQFATKKRKTVIVILTVLIFYWTTQMLIRTLHQYLGIPFNFDSMYHSLVVQMALSIYWCLIATGLMIYATRKKWRTPWITGAIILGVIVLKLIFVDYWNRAALEQTVSTIIVGLLFLIIGYFSPIPPRKKEKI